MSADIVYPNWVTENVQVHYNDDQEWYYLSNHVPSEVLVFTSAQSNREKPDGKLLSDDCRFIDFI